MGSCLDGVWWIGMVMNEPGAQDKLDSVVFCWELGGGLGHISKAAILAERLLDQGCQISFMLRDAASIDDLLPREAYRVLQAPVSWGVPAGWPAAADHAELLISAGFGDGPGLRGRVRAWTDSFDALQADLVIADHAPTAMLAARCLGLPTALFGLGFFAPPAPWPVFRHWESPTPARQARARQIVTTQVNQCLQSFGAAPIADLPELLDADRNFLLTVPELDHYPRTSDGSHRGCVLLDDVGVAPPWPSGGRDGRVFAYLRPELPGLEAVLGALAASDRSVLVRCAGIDESLKARFTAPNLAFSAQWVRMADVAREAAVVVCSGTDTAHGMALRGLPVLCLPMNAEQRVGAERLQATGAGLWVLPGADRDAIGRCLQTLLADPAPRLAAAALAQRHGAQAGRAVMDGVARDCLALLRERASRA
jgi:hypothetical protein